MLLQPGLLVFPHCWFSHEAAQLFSVKVAHGAVVWGLNTGFNAVFPLCFYLFHVCGVDVFVLSVHFKCVLL